MNLINQVDVPGSDIDHYVHNLDKILLKKVEKINQLRQQLVKFGCLLKDEEALSQKFIANEVQKSNFDENILNELKFSEDKNR